MLIANLDQAKNHAVVYLQHETLVVSATGEISADCDIDATCKVYEARGEAFFIVNGVRKVKEIKEVKKAKDKQND